jgi:thiopeptide-type bacteriocin biosynthesis protein
VPDEWLQAHAGLDRAARPARESARLAFAAVEPAVDQARGDGLEVFFFQRKPPDLRLRFGGADADRLQARLAPVLDRLVSDRVLTSWYPTPYEPEWRKVGGHAAMAGYHRWADVDTAAWLAVDRWAATQADAHDDADAISRLARSIVGANLDDLFVEGVGDGHEVWDTWCNVATLAGPDRDPGPDAGAGPPTDDGDRIGDGDHPSVDDDAVAAPLGRLRAANVELAVALRRALADGGSDTGLRATLAFMAQLSLNRWGLDGPAQRDLATRYAAARDPRSTLRGADPPPH